MPLTITYEGGASQDDYTGVPKTVRFASNEKQQKFTLTAEADDLAEEGEKVVIALGRLPSRVTRGEQDTTAGCDCRCGARGRRARAAACGGGVVWCRPI